MWAVLSRQTWIKDKNYACMIPSKMSVLSNLGAKHTIKKNFNYISRNFCPMKKEELNQKMWKYELIIINNLNFFNVYYSKGLFSGTWKTETFAFLHAMKVVLIALTTTVDEWDTTSRWSVKSPSWKVGHAASTIDRLIARF